MRSTSRFPSARVERPSVRSHGFTLVEVVVLLAVVTALTALLMPTLAAMVASDNERATRERAEAIYTAIYGDPARGEFGYLGDMGRLPATLTELVERGTQPAWHTADGGVDHVGKVGTGWRGPYLRDFFSTSDLLTDAWAQPFSFSNGQITSGGPDGQTSTTGDNIVFPVHAAPATGTMFVSVLANRIPDAYGATAKLYTTANGEQTASATNKNTGQSTFDGFWFENVTQGLHVLKVAHTGADSNNNCLTVTRFVTVAVYAGQQAVRDVRMLTNADVKVTDNPCTIPD